jgi:glycosyltransferase involved in cell wall biosynthesis
MSISISIIIPVYNADRFIAATIDSVLAQTFSDFEVVVVNDGSTDGTQGIVEQYMQRDRRVQLISQPNQGISATRKRGQQASQGEFLAFLDADDLWCPNNLELHLQHFANRPNLGLSFGRVEFMRQDGTLTGTYSTSQLEEIEPVHLFYENLLVTSSNMVIRRVVLEEVGSFDVELCGTEDQELPLRICCAGWEVEGIDKVLVYYRTTMGGMSSRLEVLETDWFKFSDKVRIYASDLVAQHGSTARAYFLRYLARRSLRVSNSRTMGLWFLYRALRLDWTLLIHQPRRTWLTLVAVCCKPFLPNFL